MVYEDGLRECTYRLVTVSTYQQTEMQYDGLVRPHLAAAEAAPTTSRTGRQCLKHSK